MLPTVRQVQRLLALVATVNNTKDGVSLLIVGQMQRPKVVHVLKLLMKDLCLMQIEILLLHTKPNFGLNFVLKSVSKKKLMN